MTLYNRLSFCVVVVHVNIIWHQLTFFLLTLILNFQNDQRKLVHFSFSAPPKISLHFTSFLNNNIFPNASWFSESALDLERKHHLKHHEGLLPPLCSDVSLCHQTPSLLKSSDLWWNWSLRHLCQLIMLLFPLQESQVTSDHSPDPAFILPLVATVGDFKKRRRLYTEQFYLCMSY